MCLKKLVVPVKVTVHLSFMPAWSAEDQVSQWTPEVIVSGGDDGISVYASECPAHSCQNALLLVEC